MRKGERIPDSDDPEDEELLEYSDLADAANEEAFARTYPPDKGYLIKQRFTSEWQYLSSPPAEYDRFGC